MQMIIGRLLRPLNSSRGCGRPSTRRHLAHEVQNVRGGQLGGTTDRSLRRWLRPANGNGWKVAAPGASQQRLALVHQLLAALREGDGEPALQALLQQERARLGRQSHTVRTRKDRHHALRTLKPSLCRYQHDGVERFLVRGRLRLADDMGLGKTAPHPRIDVRAVDAKR